MGQPNEPDTAAAAPSPPIAYASAPPDRAAGVVVRRDPHHVEIIVAPVEKWAALPRGLRLAIPIVLLIILWQAAVILSTNRYDWTLALSNTVIYGGVIVAIVALAYVRLHRWLRFIVTADRFYLIRRVGGLSETTTSWRRTRLLAATVSAVNGKLLLRILGQDTLEIFVATDRAAARHVAETLEAARNERFEPVTSAGVAPVLDRPPSPSRRAQRLALAAATAAGAILAILFLIGHPVAQIALAAAVLAAIPLGIRYGTQDKDYYI
jgi:hypothetical protein